MICSLEVDECFVVAPEIHKGHNPVLARRKLGIRVPPIPDLNVEILVYPRLVIRQIHRVPLS